MSREEEFEALIAQYDAAMRRIVRVHAGSDGDGEDLYQEILLQLWKSFPSFRGDSKPGTWLYRVALNTALTWQRKAISRRSGESRNAPLEPPDMNGRREGIRSQKEILAEFLDLLTGPDRWALLLYMEGLKQQEIAEVTGMSENAVAVRIHRMKNMFMERYLDP